MKKNKTSFSNENFIKSLYNFLKKLTEKVFYSSDILLLEEWIYTTKTKEFNLLKKITKCLHQSCKKTTATVP